MEYLAFQRSMSHIKQENIKLDCLVTDRRASIPKHMKENEKSVNYYFDLWHLRKSKLSAIKQIFTTPVLCSLTVC